MWEINLELVDQWLSDLDKNSYEQTIAALTILQDLGPSLGRPLVDR